MQVDSIILQVDAQSTWVNLQCLCDILRRYEVRELTSLVGSNTAQMTFYYTSIVLPLLTLFLDHHGINTKPFLYLIVFVT